MREMECAPVTQTKERTTANLTVGFFRQSAHRRTWSDDFLGPDMPQARRTTIPSYKVKTPTEAATGFFG